MRRGKNWFTCKEDCKKEGKRNDLSYTTFDGSGVPLALLYVEAVCPCFVLLKVGIKSIFLKPGFLKPGFKVTSFLKFGF